MKETQTKTPERCQQKKRGIEKGFNLYAIELGEQRARAIESGLKLPDPMDSEDEKRRGRFPIK